MGKHGKYTRERRRLMPRLLEEQRYRCCYCLCELSSNAKDKNKQNYATIEHVIGKQHFILFHGKRKADRHYHPRHYDYMNLVVACAKCNHMRGEIDVWLFHDYKLWLPENAHLRKIQELMIAFKRHQSIKSLIRMARYCKCEACQAIWKPQPNMKKAA